MAEFLLDSFTAVDGTDLASHAPETGGAWSESSALAATINTNHVDGPAAFVVAVVNAAVPAAADYHVGVDVSQPASGGSYAGPLCRWSGGAFGTGYILYFYPPTLDWVLSRWNSGAETTLGTWHDGTFTSGTHRAVVECLGTTINGIIDGTLRITATDSGIATIGQAGFIIAPGGSNGLTIDNCEASDTPAPPPGTHVVSGRGSFSIGGLGWLSTSITGRPSVLTSGMAEPPNWYHVGMLSWGTTHGIMTAYPVTRDLDLVELPAGLSEVHYEFFSGVLATIVELAAP